MRCEKQKEMIETVQDTRNLIHNTIIPNICRTTVLLWSRTALWHPAAHSQQAVSLDTTGSRVTMVLQCRSIVTWTEYIRTGGWTRVANPNTSNPYQQCLVNGPYSSELKRLCERGRYSGGCLSALYNTYSISYSYMCRKVTGYQLFIRQYAAPKTIEDPYVDGISLWTLQLDFLDFIF